MEINTCSKTYSGVKVLEMPAFDFEPGKIYAVLGANGSGKSTYARIAAGIEKTDEGTFLHTEKGSVGYMPQKSYAFGMSVEKNILMNGKDHEKASYLIDFLNLSSLSRKNAKKLSGGELAKTALARIMMKHYDLLILDEPCASMDMESTILAEKLIKQYRDDENCAVLLITHSLAQARRIADEAVFLNAGKLSESGDAGKLLYEPDTEEARRFIEFYG